MKTIAFSIAAILLTACAGMGSGDGGTGRGAGAAGGSEYNRDVREAVTRGSTQGVDPL